VGLGEGDEEVLDVLAILHQHRVRTSSTIGQYLSPGPKALPVSGVSPEQFQAFRLPIGGNRASFLQVVSSRFTRSSYPRRLSG